MWDDFIYINRKYYGSRTDLEFITFSIDHEKKSGICENLRVSKHIETCRTNVVLWTYFEYELPRLHMEYSGALLQFFRCNLDAVTIYDDIALSITI